MVYFSMVLTRGNPPSNSPEHSPPLRRSSTQCSGACSVLIRDFKDTVYPLFESYTLFLEFIFVPFLAV